MRSLTTTLRKGLRFPLFLGCPLLLLLLDGEERLELDQLLEVLSTHLIVRAALTQGLDHGKKIRVAQVQAGTRQLGIQLLNLGDQRRGRLRVALGAHLLLMLGIRLGLSSLTLLLDRLQLRQDRGRELLVRLQIIIIRMLVEGLNYFLSVILSLKGSV